VAVTISAETGQFLAGQDRKLGWPLSEDLPIGDGANRIQVFENGAVILWDGKPLVLLRAEPEAGTLVEVGPAEVPPSPTSETPRSAGPYEAGVTVPGWKSYPR
jgi:hypothetical protein